MKDTTKLERLLNKTVIYKQEHLTIKDWFMKDEEGTVTIITSRNPITIPVDDINDFYNKCLPIEEETSLQVVTESQQMITSLKDILMDNIKKVQQNKDYIQQAKTINNSVSAMLNMVSLQLKIGRKA